MPRKSKKKCFEDLCKELESIIEKLESGHLSLEDSLELFEKGINLAKQSDEILAQAEQKVKVLSSKAIKDDSSNGSIKGNKEQSGDKDTDKL